MTPTLTAALASVEAAWETWQPESREASHVARLLTELMLALRAVRSSGGTVCVLSRESVEAVRKWEQECVEFGDMGSTVEVRGLLFGIGDTPGDLADVLKETP